MPGICSIISVAVSLLDFTDAKVAKEEMKNSGMLLFRFFIFYFPFNLVSIS